MDDAKTTAPETRLMLLADADTRPNAGIITAIDYAWDRKDTGGAWLVVERGQRMAGATLDTRMYVLDAGRIVATAQTEEHARRLARRHEADCRRKGVSGRTDVVRRDAVGVREGDGQYGCSLA